MSTSAGDLAAQAEARKREERRKFSQFGMPQSIAFCPLCDAPEAQRGSGYCKRHSAMFGDAAWANVNKRRK